MERQNLNNKSHVCKTYFKATQYMHTQTTDIHNIPIKITTIFLLI